MRQFLRTFAQTLARRRIAKRCVLQVAPGAQVNYRGLQHFPPSRLSIGAGSIFQGSISSDREGSEVVIGSNSFVGGTQLVCAQRIEIGDDVLISWGGTIVDHDSHSLVWAERERDVSNTFQGHPKDWTKVRVLPVRICNRAWIGFNVAILRGITIGEGAVVGACSVVTRDVAPYTVVAGNPARLIRELPHDQRR